LVPGGHLHLIKDTKFGRFSEIDSSNNKIFSFSSEENQSGMDWLRGVGWETNQPFVCLIVRDAEYLARDVNQGRGKDYARQSWSYHSYRDSNILDYERGIEWLLEQGIWIFRMGKLAGTKLSISHPRLVDYAFLPHRSDFLDVWLFANATATITTGSGPDMISSCYNKPILYLNFLPLLGVHSWTNSLTVPKNLQWMNNNNSLNIGEHISSYFLSTRDFEAAGVSIVDLTSEEIVDAVKEFWFNYIESAAISADNQSLQNRFWDDLKNNSRFHELHKQRHSGFRIGTSWLSKTYNC